MTAGENAPGSAPRRDPADHRLQDWLELLHELGLARRVALRHAEVRDDAGRVYGDMMARLLKLLALKRLFDAFRARRGRRR